MTTTADPTIVLPAMKPPLSADEIKGIFSSMTSQLQSTMGSHGNQVQELKPALASMNASMTGMQKSIQDFPTIVYETMHKSPWPGNMHDPLQRLFPHDDETYGWFLADQTRSDMSDNIWSAIVTAVSGSTALTSTSSPEELHMEQLYRVAVDPSNSSQFFACGTVQDFHSKRNYLWITKLKIDMSTKQVSMLDNFVSQDATFPAQNVFGVDIVPLIVGNTVRVFVLAKTKPITSDNTSSTQSVKGISSKSQAQVPQSETLLRRDQLRQAMSTLRGEKTPAELKTQVSSKGLPAFVTRQLERKMAHVKETAPVALNTSWIVCEWKGNQTISTLCNRPVSPSSSFTVSDSSPVQMCWSTNTKQLIVLSRIRGISTQQDSAATTTYETASIAFDTSNTPIIPSTVTIMNTNDKSMYAVCMYVNNNGELFVLGKTMDNQIVVIKQDTAIVSINIESVLKQTGLNTRDAYQGRYSIWPLAFNRNDIDGTFTIALFHETTQSLIVWIGGNENLPTSVVVHPLSEMVMPTFCTIDYLDANTTRLTYSGVLFPTGSAASEWSQPYVGSTTIVRDVTNGIWSVGSSHQPWLPWTEDTSCTSASLSHCVIASNGVALAVGWYDFSILTRDRDAYIVCWKL